MKNVSATVAVTNVTSLTFNFSNTQRNQPVSLDDIQGDYIITLNGDIVQKKQASKSATITIIGGTEAHLNRKDNEEVAEYYLNNSQKAAIHQILYNFAIRAKFNGSIGSGNNDHLNIVAETAFENYRS